MQGISTSIIFSSIVLIAFLASKFVTRFGKNITFIKSIVFFLLGILLGPIFSKNLITSDGINSLKLLTFFLGSILSFYIGLRINYATKEKSLYFKTFFINIFNSFIFIVMLSIFAIKIFNFNLDQDSFDLIIQLFSSDYGKIILILSLMGCYSSGLSHFYHKNDIRSENLVYNFVERVSVGLQSWSSIFVGVIILIILWINKVYYFEKDYYYIFYFILCLIVGPILGLLFAFFIGNTNEDKRIILATLGGVFFAAGVGFYLGIGIITINLFMGMVVGKVFQESEKLGEIISQQETPMMAIITIIASSMINVPSMQIIMFTCLYIGLRLIILNLTTSPLIQFLFFKNKHHFQKIGRGIIAQDIIPVVVSLFIGEYYPSIRSDLIFITLISMIFFEWIGERKATQLLLDSDEIKISKTTKGLKN